MEHYYVVLPPIDAMSSIPESLRYFSPKLSAAPDRKAVVAWIFDILELAADVNPAVSDALEADEPDPGLDRGLGYRTAWQMTNWVGCQIVESTVEPAVSLYMRLLGYDGTQTAFRARKLATLAARRLVESGTPKEPRYFYERMVSELLHFDRSIYLNSEHANDVLGFLANTILKRLRYKEDEGNWAWEYLSARTTSQIQLFDCLHSTGRSIDPWGGMDGLREVSKIMARFADGEKKHHRLRKLLRRLSRSAAAETESRHLSGPERVYWLTEDEDMFDTEDDDNDDEDEEEDEPETGDDDGDDDEEDGEDEYSSSGLDSNIESEDSSTELRFNFDIDVSTDSERDAASNDSDMDISSDLHDDGSTEDGEGSGSGTESDDDSDSNVSVSANEEGYHVGDDDLSSLSDADQADDSGGQLYSDWRRRLVDHTLSESEGELARRGATNDMPGGHHLCFDADCPLCYISSYDERPDALTAHEDEPPLRRHHSLWHSSSRSAPALSLRPFASRRRAPAAPFRGDVRMYPERAAGVTEPPNGMYQGFGADTAHLEEPTIAGRWSPPSYNRYTPRQSASEQRSPLLSHPTGDYLLDGNRRGRGQSQEARRVLHRRRRQRRNAQRGQMSYLHDQGAPLSVESFLGPVGAAGVRRRAGRPGPLRLSPGWVD